jgi:diguanylate cyclase (GGDEF)-like protein
MSLTPTEMVFIAARFGIVALCLLTLLVVGHHARQGERRFESSPRSLLVLTAALALVAGLLTINDIRAAVSPGDQMATYAGAWLWLFFDAGVPLLLIWVLRLVRQRDEALATLARASVTDALTELANRRGFAMAAAAALQACQRRGEAAAVVMFDLDRFKAINDGHGHAAGDAVLRGVADVLRRDLRASDVVGRLGGEEFAVLCPGMSVPQAAELAERVRASIRGGVPHPAGGEAIVTTSAGVAAVDGKARGLEASLIAADRALYAAKEAGRDRVAIADAAT